MDSNPETGAPGPTLASAARSAVEVARSLAALSTEQGNGSPYPAGRAAELEALAEQLGGAAEEWVTLADRAAAAPPDEAERLGLRRFDLAFDVLEAAAALVRLAAVDGLAGRRLELAHEAGRVQVEAATAARAVAAPLAGGEELRLRLRIADAIGDELRAALDAAAPLTETTETTE